MNNTRAADHKMKMLVKLARRGASQRRLNRAMRAHKKEVGDTEDVSEEQPNS